MPIGSQEPGEASPSTGASLEGETSVTNDTAEVTVNSESIGMLDCVSSSQHRTGPVRLQDTYETSQDGHYSRGA